MSAAQENAISESVDHLFRRHAGQMVAALSRVFGLERLDQIEDAVQDALVAALKTWPYSGFPDHPQAWLIQVSKNKMLDRLRRDKRLGDLDEVDPGEVRLQQFDAGDSVHFRNELGEDQLRMIFACCHPSIPPDSQVALTLKIVGGFGVTEIAAAYLSNADAVTRMLSRAKRKLRESVVELEIPAAAEIPARLDAVLKVLYLMFNEGYAATEGESLVRHDLCHEAIRLCRLLTEHPLTSTPRTHALAALLMFQGARLGSRHDELGDLLLLSEQDHRWWDQRMLGGAMHHFRLSAAGDELSDYHLEAEIAACHALAPEFIATDWPRILECYDLLQARSFSPVVELNRIVVLARIEGAHAALDALNRLHGDAKLDRFGTYHIVRAHLLTELGDTIAARKDCEAAIALTRNEPVRRFLLKKLERLS
jgi:RNA polymerase sigma-70 factor (ECF subfamily)